MAICSFAVWRPVSAHGGVISSILGVVEHVTAGQGDPFNEFANPANKVSSHFGILNGQGGTVDGRLEQYVDTSLQSWAQAAGNGTYISVETEGLPTEPLTSAQVATFGRLMAWINATHGVPLVITDTVGQRGLITHGDGGQPWGGHTGCPGDIRKAQRAAILAIANPQEDDEMSPDFAIRLAYRVCLHREADQAGFATYMAQAAAGKDLGDIFAEIQDSGEGQAVLKAERKSLGLA